MLRLGLVRKYQVTLRTPLVEPPRANPQFPIGRAQTSLLMCARQTSNPAPGLPRGGPAWTTPSPSTQVPATGPFFRFKQSLIGHSNDRDTERLVFDDPPNGILWDLGTALQARSAGSVLLHGAGCAGRALGD